MGQQQLEVMTGNHGSLALFHTWSKPCLLLKSGVNYFFSVKCQVVNTLGFVSHLVSPETTQLCPCCANSHRQYVNKWGFLCSNKLYLQK